MPHEEVVVNLSGGFGQVGEEGIRRRGVGDLPGVQQPAPIGRIGESIHSYVRNLYGIASIGVHFPKLASPQEADFFAIGPVAGIRFAFGTIGQAMRRTAAAAVQADGVEVQVAGIGFQVGIAHAVQNERVVGRNRKQADPADLPEGFGRQESFLRRQCGGEQEDVQEEKAVSHKFILLSQNFLDVLKLQKKKKQLTSCLNQNFQNY